MKVRLTHPDKVMYAGEKITKQDVAEYYAEFSQHILKHIKGRPLSLYRCPEGIKGECFFQKHHIDSTPSEIGSTSIQEKNGKNTDYLVVNDVKGLVSTAQIGALELHVWGSRADKIELPERIVFDLDPSPTVSFKQLVNAAIIVRDNLAKRRMKSHALLTGGKGIHVIVPIARRRKWPEVKSLAKEIADRLVEAYPDLFIATASKAKRRGKIYIDWLRNERGATAIAPYSLRARKGAPIATPVSWKELSRLSAANTFTIKNIRTRMSRQKVEPWS